MRTTLNQKFSSLEELNEVSDNYPCAHKSIRGALIGEKHFNPKKHLRGKSYIAIHVNGNSRAAILFVAYRGLKKNDFHYIPWSVSEYTLNFNYPLIKRHLPKNWNGENGTFRNGENIEKNFGYEN